MPQTYMRTCSPRGVNSSTWALSVLCRRKVTPSGVKKGLARLAGAGWGALGFLAVSQLLQLFLQRRDLRLQLFHALAHRLDAVPLRVRKADRRLVAGVIVGHNAS